MHLIDEILKIDAHRKTRHKELDDTAQSNELAAQVGKLMKREEGRSGKSQGSCWQQ
jgi:hypothetical protein